jgi:cobalt-zinc-cadmium efflux system outer membrane protein
MLLLPRAALALLVLASGVALSPARSFAEAPPTPRPLGRDLPTYQAPADPSAPALPAAAPEPSGTIALADALSAAVSRSPALVAFSWEVRARDAELLQAGAFPNPELATEVEDFAGSGERRGFGGSQTTLSFAQLIELGGKRGKRMQVASLERDLAAWDFEAARLSLLAETTKAFVATLALQERVALASELVRIGDESLRTVRTAVRAGGTSPVEASRSAVAVEQTAIERERATRALAAARAALAASWGARAAAFDRVVGDLDAIAAPPPLDRLAQALAENPDLARWATEARQREAALEQQRARRIPDVTFGLGPRYYADDSSAGLVAGLSVPLPLFDRNRGGILQAEYRLKRAASEQAAAETAAQAQLASAYQALAAAHAEVVALRERALPAAESAYSGALEAYRTARFRYLEVLDAQRTLFELRASELDALAAYHSAAADIERLTGTPLVELSRRP